jgi:hypothetical protein
VPIFHRSCERTQPDGVATAIPKQYILRRQVPTQLFRTASYLSYFGREHCCNRP